VEIAVADATHCHFDQHFSRPRSFYLNLTNIQLLANLKENRSLGFHFSLSPF